MKVAFVNDACERLGVEYLSAVLKAAGHEVRLFVDPQLFDDENVSIKALAKVFDGKKKLIEELQAYKPDLVGMSVVTDFYQWAIGMTRLIKAAMDVPIILGGIHPTSVPERVIAEPGVDMVCVGEGEQALLELVDSMARGVVDHGIRNIWFKKDGQIIRNEVRPLVEDLDALPMPDKDLYYSVSPHFSECYYIMASRGCAYACSYCCHSYLKQLHQGKGRYLRQRSAGNVIEELVLAKQRGIKHVRFFDDSLGANKAWLREFASPYRDKVGLPFICYLHPEHVTAETLDLLKLAGCREIEMGVQSLVERTRMQLLNRCTSDASIEQAIDLIKSYGFSLITDNIVGLPQDGLEAVEKAARFYNRRRPNRIYFFWLRYYPNIQLTHWALENKVLTREQYEDVHEGRNARPFSRGGDINDRMMVKLQILFLLMPMLPVAWVDRILDQRSYRHFPIIFPPAVLAAFTSLFSNSLNDKIVHRREIKHYLFGVKWLWGRRA
jgi:radical SAM superfamily enzyme YgiQ (UPF0313 family)